MLRDRVIASCETEQVVLSGLEPKTMSIAMDKVMGILDPYIPESGFVNGFDAPTKADLAILVLTQGLIPFGATLGDYDFGAKVHGLSEL